MKDLIKYIVIALIAVFLIISVKNYMNKPKTETSNNNAPGGLLTETRPNGLKIQDVKLGSGKEAACGNEVSVNYTGTFRNGKKFDSSYDRNEPFSFTLCKGEVIKGWDQGVLGMRVGGKRKLDIPANLAYGANGSGPVPANSDLLFDVEVMNIK